MPILSNAVSRPLANFDLLANLVRKDIKVRYMGTSLGIVWSLFNPALTTLTYLIVFTWIFPSPLDRFPLYLVTGIVHWTLFSQVISQSGDWMTANGGLLKKMHFPHFLAPAAGMLSLLTFWSAAFIVYLCMFPLLGGKLSPALLFYLPTFIGFLFFTYGLGLLISVLQVYYRDIRHIVDSVLPLAFWMTPIAWMEKSLPEEIRWIGDINPVSPFIRSFASILHDNSAPTLNDALLMLLLTAASIALGLFAFSRNSDTLVEKL